MGAGGTEPGSRIDHVGVIVDDLEQGVRFLERAFGLTVGRSVEPECGPMRARFLGWGEVAIELIELEPGDLRRERLGDLPARIDHIAIEVDDLDAALARAAAAGGRAPPEPLELGGRRTAFLDPEQADGITYQLLERRSDPGE